MTVSRPKPLHPCAKRVSAGLSFEPSQAAAKGSFVHAPSHSSESESCGNFDSKTDLNQPSATDSVAFSEVQPKGPAVIEVFCGSARVTACLKEVGLSQSFGVDHDVSKATSTAKRLDLTVKSDQDIFFQWMRSPLVVGLFIAPPCGTCSLARSIKLRDP